MDTKFTGTWQAVSAELAGNSFPPAVTDTIKLKIDGNQYEMQNDSGTITYLPDNRMEIKGVKGPNQGKTFVAIYKLAAEEMTVCYDLTGVEWPKGFETKPGTQLFLVRYKKAS